MKKNHSRRRARGCKKWFHAVPVGVAARRLVVLGAEAPMELAENKPGGKGEK